MSTFPLHVKDIKRNIETFYASIHRRIQEKFYPLFESDRIYMQAVQTYTMLQEFGLVTPVVDDYYNKITVIKIGASIAELNRLTTQFATNNGKRQHGKPIEQELTEAEMKLVVHWHQFISAKQEKNPAPFTGEDY